MVRNLLQPQHFYIYKQETAKQIKEPEQMLASSLWGSQM